MKNLFIRLLSSGAIAASLGVGLAHASNSISDTGPHSNNQIRTSSQSSFNETNTNTVSVSTNNNQSVHSGNAVVSGNTIGGSAHSGNTSNSVSQSTNVSISSPNNGYVVPSYGSGSNSISNTGPHSNNQITTTNHSTVTETNTNNVNVSTNNNQTVQSGSAIVRGNTVSGSAYSGSVSNTVWQSTNVNIDSGSYSGPSQGYQAPMHPNPPVKSDTSMHDYNPWMVSSEVRANRRDDYGNNNGYGDSRYVAMYTAAYRSQPCPPPTTVPPRPCPPVNYGTIRPPCHPVVTPPCRPVVTPPCHPVVTPPCHQQECRHIVRHCQHHQVHKCVPQHQNHHTCRR